MSDNHKPQLAWIENGILYFKFEGEITTQSVIEAGQKAELALQAHPGGVMPAIIDIREVDDTKTNLHLADLGKLITSYADILHNESVIIVVGAKSNAHKLLAVLGKVFLAGKLRQVSTMTEAQQIARTYLSEKDSILE